MFLFFWFFFGGSIYLIMMKNLGKSVVAKLLPSENKKAAQAAAQAIAELELHDKRDILKLFKVSK